MSQPGHNSGQRIGVDVGVGIHKLSATSVSSYSSRTSIRWVWTEFIDRVVCDASKEATGTGSKTSFDKCYPNPNPSSIIGPPALVNMRRCRERLRQVGEENGHTFGERLKFDMWYHTLAPLANRSRQPTHECRCTKRQ